MEQVRDRATGKLRDPREGDVVQSADGRTRYRIGPGGTRVRVGVKAKGKAARRLEKELRRLERDEQRARDGARAYFDELAAAQ